MQKEFIQAIKQIADEKGLSHEIIIETVEAALAAAYRKDYGDRDQEVRVALDQDSGAIRVYVTKEVVAEVENEYLQMTLADAKKIKKTAKIGDMVEYEDEPRDFGRVAAQTAKQVIIQRIREAEREVVYDEYKDKEDTIMSGMVQRVEGPNVFMDLGRATGIMFPAETIPGEHYYVGQRLKVYVVRVEQAVKGPQIVVSRAAAGVVKKLFELEVPELEAGTVHIKGVAREAGARTKIAVYSSAEGVDAVGTFVGGRGTRVQAVMADLGEEKIDVILYDDDPKAFITNALSPTKVIRVDLNKADKKATVKVPEDQLSLAIGKQGQNVRLAARLTGWNIDIVGGNETAAEPATAAAKSAKPRRGKVDLEDAVIKAAQAAETEPAVITESEPKLPTPIDEVEIALDSVAAKEDN